MMILLTGGSACGKSTYAEKLAASFAGPRYYLACMRPFDAESRRKIARHREMRAGKGFETIERYTDIGGVRLHNHGGVALLECLCNLTANEMFDRDGAGEQAESAVIAGIVKIKEQCDILIVVTNDVGSDGGNYDQDTMRYIRTLGRINRSVASMSDRVMELVCGIPLPVKGEVL